MDEAAESLITVHLLNVPATLHLSLLSTNAIENLMRNYRGQAAKITRWRAETEQISRWSATPMLHVETGFRRIKGHADLPKWVNTLHINPFSVPEFEGLRPSQPPRALLLLFKPPTPETNLYIPPSIRFF